MPTSAPGRWYALAEPSSTPFSATLPRRMYVKNVVRLSSTAPPGELGRGLVGTRPRIEDPEHRVEQRGLADAGIAGQQGAVAVHVHRVGAMESGPS